jgi:hypothetical protein
MGCKNTAGLKSAPNLSPCAAIFLSFISLILADTLSTSALGASCANICHELLPQRVAARLSHGMVVMYRSQGAKKVTSLNSVLLGISS